MINSYFFRKGILLVALLLAGSVSAQTYLQPLGAPINGEAANDRSGVSVSTSDDGSTVAIGAYFNDGNGTNSGHVRVYSWNGSAWVQKGADLNGEAFDDWSGFSVSISADGNTVAIGAPNNDGSGLNAGHVRVYSWNGNTWVQMATDLNGEASDDAYGTSVSLSDDGQTLAVGAIGNDGNGTDAGHVRVFLWNGTAWMQRGADINGESASDGFGGSVSLNANGNILAVGATGNDGAGSNAGHTRIFSWNGSAWIQLGSDIDGAAAGNFSGKSVQLDNAGNRVLIGAPFYASLLGHARIFDWNGTSWIQAGPDILGEDPNEQFGVSVSISGDGLSVLAGAFGNSDAGSNAGSARAYTWNGNAWIQTGTDMDGVSAGDQCGNAVSISGDGNILAVSSYLNSTSGTSAGHVRNWTICQTATSTDTHTSCESFTWIDGITYTANNNTATFTYPGASSTGCDSVVTLNLTIIPASQSTDILTACNSYTWIDGITYTASNNSATYTFPGGSSSGCDSVVTLNLTIIPNAQGTDVIISCVPVIWIDGNTYNTSNNSATFTYPGGSYTGCDSTVTLNLTINSVSDITTSVSGVTITANNSSASYVWLDCSANFSIIPSATGQSFTPAANGTYAVQLTQNGCIDTSACVLINSVGVTEVEHINSMNIYPNPATNYFSIDLGMMNTYSIVRINDVHGRLISTQRFNQAQIISCQIDEPAGIYFVSIETEAGSFTTKLFIE